MADQINQKQLLFLICWRNLLQSYQYFILISAEMPTLTELHKNVLLSFELFDDVFVLFALRSRLHAAVQRSQQVRLISGRG